MESTTPDFPRDTINGLSYLFSETEHSGKQNTQHGAEGPPGIMANKVAADYHPLDPFNTVLNPKSNLVKKKMLSKKNFLSTKYWS